MPGNIITASPSTVLPAGLFSLFQVDAVYDGIVSEYVDGSYQASALVDAPRRKWTLARRLTPTAASALFAFYQARGGSRDKLYVYDWSEGATKFSYDLTGVATNGRFTVRFIGQYKQTIASPSPRSLNSFGLIQVT